MFVFSCNRDNESAFETDSKNYLDKAESVSLGTIHNKIMDVAIASYKKHSNLQKNNFGKIAENNEEVMGGVYDDIVESLSMELKFDKTQTKKMLEEMNYTKESFVKADILNREIDYDKANPKLRKYFNEILIILEEADDIRSFENSLNELYDSSKDLDSDEKLVLRKTIDISISSANYWTSEKSQNYHLANVYSSSRKVSPNNKAIIKADINGAIDGGIAGAIAGTALGAGVGAAPGGLFGACMGASLNSAREGLWQAMGW